MYKIRKKYYKKILLAQSCALFVEIYGFAICGLNMKICGFADWQNAKKFADLQ
jgi:hypothetical protein